MKKSFKLNKVFYLSLLLIPVSIAFISTSDTSLKITNLTKQKNQNALILQNLQKSSAKEILQQKINSSTDKFERSQLKKQLFIEDAQLYRINRYPTSQEFNSSTQLNIAKNQIIQDNKNINAQLIILEAKEAKKNLIIWSSISAIIITLIITLIVIINKRKKS